jgi:hypothetical protein
MDPGEPLRLTVVDQRSARLEVTHLGLEPLELVRKHVRRIGHDEVVPVPVDQVCLHERHVQSEAVGILIGERQRIGREIGRGYFCARVLLGDRQGDRTRAGADVEHPRALAPLEEGEAAVDHDLGLGPRYECARVGLQNETAKPPLAEHVRERLATPPSADELAYPAPLGLGQRAIVLRIQVNPFQVERVSEQMLGVEPRSGNAPCREVAGGAPQNLRQGHTAAVSSARRRSSAVSASVKSSSAPCITCSSDTLTFTRWSVTRFCGKL